MKHISTQYRSMLRTVFPALILVLLLASIAISAFHRSHDCANPDTCAICTFLASSYASSLHATPGSETYDQPVLLSIVTLPETVSAPFCTSVFASHAPPQFC